MQLVQALLFVTDLGRMQDFYGRLVGLAVLDAEPGFVRLAAGSCVLALHAIPPAHAPAIATPAVEREDGAIKLGFQVDDVDAERARLVRAGVAMREVTRWGMRAYCDGIDPEGNVFQLLGR